MTVSISGELYKMKDLPRVVDLIHSVINQTPPNYFNYSSSWTNDELDKLISGIWKYKLFSWYVFLISLWFLCALTLFKTRPFSWLKVPVEISILNTTLIVCFPIIVLVNGVVSAARHCIRVYFKHVLKGEFLLMKSADALWAQEAYAQSCNFNCLYVLEGECDLAKIRLKFLKLTQNPKYERMKRTVVEKCGFMCWKRHAKVNIHEHVRLLSGASRRTLTESQVFQKISDFSDEIFPQDKPPWEVLVVPSYEYTHKLPDGAHNGKKYYALVFRVHHALMDGISAGQVVRNEIADGPVELAVDPCAPLKISLLQKFAIYAKFSITSVRNALKSLTLMESNCFHTGQPLTGPKTFRWSHKIDLHSLRDLRSRTGATTTGILLTAFGLAMKNFAASRKLKLPNRIHAGSTVAMLPYSDVRPQNGFILAHLPIDIARKSRLENLREVQQATKNLSSSSDLLMNWLLVWLTGRWPVRVINIFLQLVHGTALVSNVPGFKNECTLFGNKLVDAVGWTPVKGSTGIGLCLFSYAGKVRAAMVADKVSLPGPTDVDELIDEFEREIENLAREGEYRGAG